MVARGERSLIARAADGDAHAFTALVGKYDRVVRSAAYNVVLDPFLVDDVVQDAYIKVYRSLGQYRGESAFSTWLHRIAARTAIDHLRRRRVQQPLDGIDPPTSQLGPEDRSIVDDQVGRALAALTPDQRAAVVLVDQLGMSYDDAADVLDVQPGTVASRVSRARARMREVLDLSETPTPANAEALDEGGTR